MSASSQRLETIELVPGFDEMFEYLGLEQPEEMLVGPCASSLSLVAFVPHKVLGHESFLVGRATRTYIDRVTTALHVAKAVRTVISSGGEVYLVRGRVGHIAAILMTPPDARLRVKSVELFELSLERDTCEMRVEPVVLDMLGAKVVKTSAWCSHDVMLLAYTTHQGKRVQQMASPHTWTPLTVVLPPHYGIEPGDSGLGVFNGRGDHVGIVIGEADGAPDAGWVVVQLNVRVDQRVLREYSRRRVFRRQKGVKLSSSQAEEYERFKDEVIAELGERAWREADSFNIGYSAGRFFIEATGDSGRIGIATIDQDAAVHFLGGMSNTQDLVDDDEDEQEFDGDEDDDSDGDDYDDGDVADDDFTLTAVNDGQPDLFAWQTKTGGLQEQLRSADAEYKQRVSRKYSGLPVFDLEKDLAEMMGLDPEPGEVAPPSETAFDQVPLPDDEVDEEPQRPQPQVDVPKAPKVDEVPNVQPRKRTPSEERELDDLFGDLGLGPDAPQVSAPPLPEIVPKAKNRKAKAPGPVLEAVTLSPRDLLRGVFPFCQPLTESEKELLEETATTISEMEVVLFGLPPQATWKTNLTAEKFQDAMAFADSLSNAKSIKKALQRRWLESGPNPGYATWEAYDRYRIQAQKILSENPKLGKYLNNQVLSAHTREEKQLSLPACYVILAKRMVTDLNNAKARLDYGEAQAKKESTSTGVVTARTHLDRMKALRDKLGANKQ